MNDSSTSPLRHPCRTNSWSAEETTTQGTLSLEVTALQILKDLQKRQWKSWTAIEAAIQHRLGHCVFTDDARVKRICQQRREGESLCFYASELQLYTWRGYPTF